MLQEVLKLSLFVHNMIEYLAQEKDWIVLEIRAFGKVVRYKIYIPSEHFGKNGGLSTLI